MIYKLYLLFFITFGTAVNGQSVKLSKFIAGDPTTALKIALYSSNDTIVIDNTGSPWLLRPLRCDGIRNKVITIEPEVRIQAKPGAFPRTNDGLFTFINSDNVSIIGSDNIIEMNKSEYTSGEWRHVISLRGCRKFKLSNLVLRDSGGDGIYIAGSNARLYSEDVRIESIKSLNNRRQGISIISAKGVHVTHSEFSYTKGTLPGAGVDIEPNRSNDVIENIYFEHCIFEDNYNAGIKIELWKLTSDSKPVSITFSDCLLKNNHHPDNPRVAAEINIGAHRTNPVKGNILFIRCTIEESSWGMLYSRKGADGFNVTFDHLNAINICQAGTMPPILLEVSDYRNLSPDLGGFHFRQTYLKYTAALPVFMVRGSKMGTLRHLRDVSGTITYSSNSSDPILYLNYDPSNNINVKLKMIKK